MKIINLTPHEINLYKHGIIMKTYKSEGIARVEQVSENDFIIFGDDGFHVQLKRTVNGAVSGLPDQQQDVFLIVSSMVRVALKRDDLISPFDFVRDDKGRIIGCESFTR